MPNSLPGFSTISGPLWDLTCTGKSRKSGTRDKEAFEHIKKLPISAPVMVYFAKDAKIRLVTKALLVGIGAVPDLEQQQEDGSYRPVCYPSRKLSNVERSYTQFEREALAVR